MVMEDKEDDVKVVGNKVLVQLDESKEQWGKLALPQDHSTRSLKGNILQIGKNVDLSQFCFKVGDKVIFSPWVGSDVQFDFGQKIKYKVIHPDDILCILLNEEEIKNA